MVEATFRARCGYEDKVDPFADLRALIAELGDPTREMIEARFALRSERPATLEEIARPLGITRERVRQRVEKAITQLQHPLELARLHRLIALVDRYAMRLDAFPTDPALAQQLELDFPAATRPVSPWLQLLVEIRPTGWTNPTRPPPPGLTEAVVATLARYGPMLLEELAACVAALCSAENDIGLLARVRTSGACVARPDGTYELLSEPIRGIPDERLRRLHSIIGVLQRDGPSHFTRVADEVNARLIPRYAMTERNVHAWLSRYQKFFIWAGPGTFALRDHGVGIQSERGGPELPAEYRPARRKGIGDEIVLLLLERGPLSIEEIKQHILPRFHVDPTSVEAAVHQDQAMRFTVRPHGLVDLRGEAEAAPARQQRWVRITDAQLDALLPRARELRDRLRADAQAGYARLDGAALFNHAVVAALLGLDRDLVSLQAAPASKSVPAGAWAAVHAMRGNSDEPS
ncbi:MAG: hypothetical protein H0V51_02025 [Chloroflexi bacterium]|nr:hypothetical protein [Chloroflexota bacterium]